MGAAGSVLSRSDLSDKLGMNGKIRLEKYEKECRSLKLDEKETYQFIESRYEELMGLDQSQDGTPAGSLLGDDSLSNISPNESENPEEFLQHILHATQSKKGFSANHQSLFDNQNLARDLAEAFAEVKDSDIIPENGQDNFDDDINKQLTGLLEKPEEDGEHHEFNCPTCQTHFTCLQDLNIHIEHSEIHAKTVAERGAGKNKLITASRRLSVIAKDTIDLFNLYGQKQKEKLVGSTTATGGKNSPTATLIPKWKTAIQKMITKKITSHYEEIASQMFYSPKDIKLMSAITKLYVLPNTPQYANLRRNPESKTPITSLTYDVRIYLHYDLHCVEIVSHILKGAPNPHEVLNEDYHNSSINWHEEKTVSVNQSFNLTSPKNAGQNRRSVDFGGSPPTKSKTERQDSEFYHLSDPDAGLIKQDVDRSKYKIVVRELPRIYLDYNLMLSTVMGLKSNNLQAVSIAAPEKKTFQQPTNSKYSNSLMDSAANQTNGSTNSFNTAITTATHAVKQVESTQPAAPLIATNSSTLSHAVSHTALSTTNNNSSTTNSVTASRNNSLLNSLSVNVLSPRLTAVGGGGGHKVASTPTNYLHHNVTDSTTHIGARQLNSVDTQNVIAGNKASGLTIDDSIITFIHSHLNLNPKKHSHHHAKHHHRNGQKVALEVDSEQKNNNDSDEELVFSGVYNKVSPIIKAPSNLLGVNAVSEDSLLRLWESSWINL